MSACPECGGTGFRIVARDGREFAERCACRRTEAADFLSACQVPPRYANCSLEHFEPGNPSLEAALLACTRYCEGYPHDGPTQAGLGLLFTGPSGIGKTHLAVAVLRELVTRKGARGQFWDFHSLVRRIKDSYNPETRTTELQVLEPVVEVDALLLDDLGAWKMTDWMLDTLFFILNGRYMAKRATLITTNFEDRDPEEVRQDGSFRRREYLVERVGRPLRSRLLEMTLVVTMSGHDYRQARQLSNAGAVLGGSKPQRP
jgi:DNA replication protein DnaC